MKEASKQASKQTSHQSFKQAKDIGRDGEIKREGWGWREGQKIYLSAELSRAWCACIYEDK